MLIIQTSPPQSSFLQSLLPLLLVLAGAVCSLGAGLVLDLRKDRAERVRGRKEKLEKVVGLLREGSQPVPWNSNVDEVNSRHRQFLQVTQEVAVLARMYFPEISSSIGTFVGVTNDYFNACFKYAETREDHEKSTISAAERREASGKQSDDWIRCMEDVIVVAGRFGLATGSKPLPPSKASAEVAANSQ